MINSNSVDWPVARKTIKRCAILAQWIQFDGKRAYRKNTQNLMNSSIDLLVVAFGCLNLQIWIKYKRKKCLIFHQSSYSQQRFGSCVWINAKNNNLKIEFVAIQAFVWFQEEFHEAIISYRLICPPNTPYTRWLHKKMSTDTYFFNCNHFTQADWHT